MDIESVIKDKWYCFHNNGLEDMQEVLKNLHKLGFSELEYYANTPLAELQKENEREYHFNFPIGIKIDFRMKAIFKTSRGFKKIEYENYSEILEDYNIMQSIMENERNNLVMSKISKLQQQIDILKIQIK